MIKLKPEEKRGLLLFTLALLILFSIVFVFFVGSAWLLPPWAFCP